MNMKTGDTIKKALLIINVLVIIISVVIIMASITLLSNSIIDAIIASVAIGSANIMLVVARLAANHWIDCVAICNTDKIE